MSPSDPPAKLLPVSTTAEIVAELKRRRRISVSESDRRRQHGKTMMKQKARKARRKKP